MADLSGPIDESGSANMNGDGGVDGPSSIVCSMGPPSPLTGCYLLIILGEPHSNENKDIILQRLVKGLLSWDMSDCHVDLEEELNAITLQAPEGEEARHGERLIQYASENLVTEILIHPQYNTLIQCMRNLLSSFTRHRHIIHAGYTFAGNGSWILQDGTFSVADFSEAFQEHEVQRVFRAYPDTISTYIHCAGAGFWHSLPDKPFARSNKIRINPVDVLDSGSDKINAFIEYLAPMLIPASLTDLLESSDVVGNIRFSHPTLYVFPGGQGDAALFGINGFNMLVDGGFNRKACFWDFARHLDRLDAVLLTRVNNSNIQGMSSVVERKHAAHVYPQIGHFFTNIPENKSLPSPDGDKDKDPLQIDLIERGSQMVNNLRSINLKPQTCYRDIDPMNLYHKVGHGTLDMYVISPGKDSKEVREFLQKWQASDQRLFSGKDTREFQFPLENLVSICALLVWQPASPDDTITRILFPGSTPDFKIMEGLEKIKHLEFMKHPMCTAKKLAASISSTTFTKKAVKSAPIEKPIAEPIVPSHQKVIKPLPAPEKDNRLIDNKIKSIQTDNKIKESKLIEDQIAEIKPKPIKRIEDKSEMMQRTEKEDSSEKKVEEQINGVDKSGDELDSDKVVDETTKENGDIKLEIESIKEKVKKTETKIKTESKTQIKSRIDSKQPKSMERKKRETSEKRELGKSSPTATPKKAATDQSKLVNGASSKEKETKSRVISRVSRSSPSSTPAKSAKEANNRKVLESKQKAVTKSVKKEVSARQVIEKKEVKEIKTERKPISRRTKAKSPSRRAISGSPIKSAKPKTEKDMIIRKRLDKGGTTDSSLVSTPSADEVTKKITDAELSADPEVIAKQRELDDLQEEQEAVREIEAVFKRDEILKSKDQFLDHRDALGKQDSTTEAEDDEEYLIIEKEEVDQYTEDSINEPESSLTKEEEIQKHQRDSQESEKKRKMSIEKSEERREAELKPEKEMGEPDIAIEESSKTTTKRDESELKETVQEIILSAREIVKTKSDEEVAKADDISSPSPEDKLSQTKKTSDTKDDQIEGSAPGQDIKDGEVQNLPESSQPFSGTIESGATTAPTLPEDERMSLQQIKEDLVIEDKLIQEDAITKQVDVPAIDVPLTKTIEPLVERVVPSKIHFDAQHQSHLRDVVKTPDEVADLPMHEEADIDTYGDGTDDKKSVKSVIKEDMKEKTVATEKLEESTQKLVTEEDNVCDEKEIKIDLSKEKKGEEDDEKEKDTREDHVQEDVSDKEKSPKDGKDSGMFSFMAGIGKKVEDKLTDIKEKLTGVTEKVEYKMEELGESFENTLKDVTPKDKGRSPEPEKEVVSDKEIDDNAISKQSEQVQEKKEISHESIAQSKDQDIVTKTEIATDITVPSSISKIDAEALDLVIDHITSDKKDTGLPTKQDKRKEDDFKQVYDYSHPFDGKSFTTELRETHITTVDSPIIERDTKSVFDINVLEKLPEQVEDEQDIDKTTTTVTAYHVDEFKYSFEREDSSLNDIKEEDEDDHFSPPHHLKSPDSIANNKEITELTDKKNQIDVDFTKQQPPRAVSPREEEVLKIVANVAEVLKSEKDIAEIIPDFSEEELEKKLLRASPRFDDEASTVQRMLVTASSEDGGEEIEICAEGTIRFSPVSVTPEPQSGIISPEIQDDKQELEIESPKSTKPSDIKTGSSTPETKTSPISIDEKDKHELSEKDQIHTASVDITSGFPNENKIDLSFPVEFSTKSVDLQLHERLAELKASTQEIISKPDIDTKEPVRKESFILSHLDDLDSRRESSISVFSERDYTKDESSIEEKGSLDDIDLKHEKALSKAESVTSIDKIVEDHKKHEVGVHDGELPTEVAVVSPSPSSASQKNDILTDTILTPKDGDKHLQQDAEDKLEVKESVEIQTSTSLTSAKANENIPDTTIQKSIVCEQMCLKKQMYVCGDLDDLSTTCKEIPSIDEKKFDDKISEKSLDLGHEHGDRRESNISDIRSASVASNISAASGLDFDSKSPTERAEIVKQKTNENDQISQKSLVIEQVTSHVISKDSVEMQSPEEKEEITKVVQETDKVSQKSLEIELDDEFRRASVASHISIKSKDELDFKSPNDKAEIQKAGKLDSEKVSQKSLELEQEDKLRRESVESRISIKSGVEDASKSSDDKAETTIAEQTADKVSQKSIEIEKTEESRRESTISHISIKSGLEADSKSPDEKLDADKVSQKSLKIENEYKSRRESTESHLSIKWGIEDDSKSPDDKAEMVVDELSADKLSDKSVEIEKAREIRRDSAESRISVKSGVEVDSKSPDGKAEIPKDGKPDTDNVSQKSLTIEQEDKLRRESVESHVSIKSGVEVDSKSSDDKAADKVSQKSIEIEKTEESRRESTISHISIKSGLETDSKSPDDKAEILKDEKVDTDKVSQKSLTIEHQDKSRRESTESHLSIKSEIKDDSKSPDARDEMAVDEINADKLSNKSLEIAKSEEIRRDSAASCISVKSGVEVDSKSTDDKAETLKDEKLDADKVSHKSLEIDHADKLRRESVESHVSIKSGVEDASKSPDDKIEIPKDEDQYAVKVSQKSIEIEKTEETRRESAASHVSIKSADAVDLTSPDSTAEIQKDEKLEADKVSQKSLPMEHEDKSRRESTESHFSVKSGFEDVSKSPDANLEIATDELNADKLSVKSVDIEKTGETRRDSAASRISVKSGLEVDSKFPDDKAEIQKEGKLDADIVSQKSLEVDHDEKLRRESMESHVSIKSGVEVDSKSPDDKAETPKDGKIDDDEVSQKSLETDHAGKLRRQSVESHVSNKSGIEDASKSPDGKAERTRDELNADQVSQKSIEIEKTEETRRESTASHISIKSGFEVDSKSLDGKTEISKDGNLDGDKISQKSLETDLEDKLRRESVESHVSIKSGIEDTSKSPVDKAKTRSDELNADQVSQKSIEIEKTEEARRESTISHISIKSAFETDSKSPDEKAKTPKDEKEDADKISQKSLAIDHEDKSRRESKESHSSSKSVIEDDSKSPDGKTDISNDGKLDGDKVSQKSLEIEHEDKVSQKSIEFEKDEQIRRESAASHFSVKSGVEVDSKSADDTADIFKSEKVDADKTSQKSLETDQDDKLRRESVESHVSVKSGIEDTSKSVDDKAKTTSDELNADQVSQKSIETEKTEETRRESAASHVSIKSGVEVDSKSPDHTAEISILEKVDADKISQKSIETDHDDKLRRESVESHVSIKSGIEDTSKSPDGKAKTTSDELNADQVSQKSIEIEKTEEARRESTISHISIKSAFETDSKSPDEKAKTPKDEKEDADKISQKSLAIDHEDKSRRESKESHSSSKSVIEDDSKSPDGKTDISNDGKLDGDKVSQKSLEIEHEDKVSQKSIEFEKDEQIRRESAASHFSVKSGVEVDSKSAADIFKSEKVDADKTSQKSLETDHDDKLRRESVESHVSVKSGIEDTSKSPDGKAKTTSDELNADQVSQKSIEIEKTEEARRESTISHISIKSGLETDSKSPDEKAKTPKDEKEGGDKISQKSLEIDHEDKLRRESIESHVSIKSGIDDTSKSPDDKAETTSDELNADQVSQKSIEIEKTEETRRESTVSQISIKSGLEVDSKSPDGKTEISKDGILDGDKVSHKSLEIEHEDKVSQKSIEFEKDEETRRESAASHFSVKSGLEVDSKSPDDTADISKSEKVDADKISQKSLETDHDDKLRRESVESHVSIKSGIEDTSKSPVDKAKTTSDELNADQVSQKSIEIEKTEETRRESTSSHISIKSGLETDSKSPDEKAKTLKDEKEDSDKISQKSLETDHDNELRRESVESHVSIKSGIEDTSKSPDDKAKTTSDELNADQVSQKSIEIEKTEETRRESTASHISIKSGLETDSKSPDEKAKTPKDEKEDADKVSQKSLAIEHEDKSRRESTESHFSSKSVIEDDSKSSDTKAEIAINELSADKLSEKSVEIDQTVETRRESAASHFSVKSGLEVEAKSPDEKAKTLKDEKEDADKVSQKSLAIEHEDKSRRESTESHFSSKSVIEDDSKSPDAKAEIAINELSADKLSEKSVEIDKTVETRRDSAASRISIKSGVEVGSKSPDDKADMPSDGKLDADNLSQKSLEIEQEDKLRLEPVESHVTIKSSVEHTLKSPDHERETTRDELNADKVSQKSIEIEKTEETRRESTASHVSIKSGLEVDLKSPDDTADISKSEKVDADKISQKSLETDHDDKLRRESVESHVSIKSGIEDTSKSPDDKAKTMSDELNADQVSQKSFEIEKTEETRRESTASYISIKSGVEADSISLNEKAEITKDELHADKVSIKSLDNEHTDELRRQSGASQVSIKSKAQIDTMSPSKAENKEVEKKEDDKLSQKSIETDHAINIQSEVKVDSKSTDYKAETLDADKVSQKSLDISHVDELRRESEASHISIKSGGEVDKVSQKSLEIEHEDDLRPKSAASDVNIKSGLKVDLKSPDGGAKITKDDKLDLDKISQKSVQIEHSEELRRESAASNVTIEGVEVDLKLNDDGAEITADDKKEVDELSRKSLEIDYGDGLRRDSEESNVSIKTGAEVLSKSPDAKAEIMKDEKILSTSISQKSLEFDDVDELRRQDSIASHFSDKSGIEIDPKDADKFSQKSLEIERADEQRRESAVSHVSVKSEGKVDSKSPDEKTETSKGMDTISQKSLETVHDEEIRRDSAASHISVKSGSAVDFKSPDDKAELMKDEKIVADNISHKSLEIEHVEKLRRDSGESHASVSSDSKLDKDSKFSDDKAELTKDETLKADTISQKSLEIVHIDELRRESAVSHISTKSEVGSDSKSPEGKAEIVKGKKSDDDEVSQKSLDIELTDELRKKSISSSSIKSGGNVCTTSPHDATEITKEEDDKLSQKSHEIEFADISRGAAEASNIMSRGSKWYIGSKSQDDDSEIAKLEKTNADNLSQKSMEIEVKTPDSIGDITDGVQKEGDNLSQLSLEIEVAGNLKQESVTSHASIKSDVAISKIQVEKEDSDNIISQIKDEQKITHEINQQSLQDDHGSIKSTIEGKKLKLIESAIEVDSKTQQYRETAIGGTIESGISQMESRSSSLESHIGEHPKMSDVTEITDPHKGEHDYYEEGALDLSPKCTDIKSKDIHSTVQTQFSQQISKEIVTDAKKGSIESHELDHDLKSESRPESATSTTSQIKLETEIQSSKTQSVSKSVESHESKSSESLGQTTISSFELLKDQSISQNVSKISNDYVDIERTTAESVSRSQKDFQTFGSTKSDIDEKSESVQLAEESQSMSSSVFSHISDSLESKLTDDKFEESTYKGDIKGSSERFITMEKSQMESVRKDESLVRDAQEITSKMIVTEKSSTGKIEDAASVKKSKEYSDTVERSSKIDSSASHNTHVNLIEKESSRTDTSASDRDGEKEIGSVKGSRSKSVSSIMMTSMYKPEGFEALSTFDEIAEHTKDDISIKSESRKASDITTMIEDVKKIDEKILSSKFESKEKVTQSVADTSKKETTTQQSTKTSSSTDITQSMEELSGKITPDIAEIERESMKTEMISSVHKSSEQSMITSATKELEIISAISIDQTGKSSPPTQSSGSKSVTTLYGHETPESSPKPTSPFPKGIETIKNEELRTSSGMTTPDLTRMSTPDVEIITTTITHTTIISADGQSTVTETKIVKSGNDIISETTTISGDRPPSKTEFTSSESHSQHTFKSGVDEQPTLAKDISLVKSEFRSYTPASDDYEIESQKSDISGSHPHIGRPGWAADASHTTTFSDDDVPASPLSITSQAPLSPTSSKFAYEGDYELQRSSSGVSKKSDLDIDDSQDDIPPAYGSKEVERAFPISSTFKPDPMSQSFYGDLPEIFTGTDVSGKSAPIPIGGITRTVITKHYEDYASSGPESSSCASQDSYAKSSDHRFLDEADMGFEKALEEHIQLRGTDVMSTVTSKYAFSPSQHSTVLADSTPLLTKMEDVQKQVKASDSTSKTEHEIVSISSTSSATTVSVESQVKSEPQQTLPSKEDKAKADEVVASWGKPLGLPTPISVDNQTTPKKERRIISSKTKLNNEKNLRKRSESPVKGKKSAPIYMDLTYVPHHGNSYYSHVEFFKRVRARYYVFSGTEPSREVYNALLEAKQTWEDKDLEVTIIPTYDTDVLGYWVAENEDLLIKYHIDLSPSASRCTINLQDHETSCSAYRLEF